MIKKEIPSHKRQIMVTTRLATYSRDKDQYIKSMQIKQQLVRNDKEEPVWRKKILNIISNLKTYLKI